MTTTVADMLRARAMGQNPGALLGVTTMPQSPYGRQVGMGPVSTVYLPGYTPQPKLIPPGGGVLQPSPSARPYPVRQPPPYLGGQAPGMAYKPPSIGAPGPTPSVYDMLKVRASGGVPGAMPGVKTNYGSWWGGPELWNSRSVPLYDGPWRGAQLALSNQHFAQGGIVSPGDLLRQLGSGLNPRNIGALLPTQRDVISGLVSGLGAEPADFWQSLYNVQPGGSNPNMDVSGNY